MLFIQVEEPSFVTTLGRGYEGQGCLTNNKKKHSKLL